MEQLLAHLVGDYILQSDWMAQNKRLRFWPCFVHCFLYACCFAPILWRHRGWAFTAILWSHFFIDRFGLARYVVWAKNWMAPLRRYRSFDETLADLNAEGTISSTILSASEARIVLADQKHWRRWNRPWGSCQATGYPPNRPEWLTVWLLIIADNTLHLLCNYAALRWL